MIVRDQGGLLPKTGHQRREPDARDGDELGARVKAALAAEWDEVLHASHGGDGVLEFARSVVTGMQASPRALECRFLYDQRGSALYEKICEQPEYYPTRTEDAILARHAAGLPELTGPVTVVELGSGSATKTHHILAAYLSRNALAGYVPVDVCRSALHGAVARLRAELPDARIAAVEGTYDRAFEVLEHTRPALLTFLGSTVGNFFAAEAAAFWERVARHLPAGSFVLLGVDLVKDAAVLDRAYDDAAGVTRAFTLNLFARMNRELGAGLDLDAIHHRARFITGRRRVEIHAEFSAAQRLHVAPLARSFEVRRGERILVEISTKYELATLLPELARHGLEAVAGFTDEQGWFADLLLRRSPSPGGPRGR